MALGALVISCGPGGSDALDASSAGDGGQGDAVVPEGDAAQDGTADAGSEATDPEKRDFDRLSSCDAAAPCPAAFFQVVEGGGTLGGIHEVECVLEAMASRTPGLYEYETDHTFTTGRVFQTHLLRVHDDGSVSYAVRNAAHRAASAGQPPPSYESRRCDLSEPDFFQSCLALLEAIETSLDEQELRNCAYANGPLDQWFDQCDQAAAMCE